jgi:hypothetical protein
MRKIARPTDKAPKTIDEVLGPTNKNAIHGDRDRK